MRKGGTPTATTYIKPHKQATKRTAIQSLKDRFDYGMNPEKLGAVSSYLCDPEIAHAEFMLVKGQYQAETGRTAEQGALCYQIRQAFPQGEVTPEEANRIGYETAMRWTKGQYQFFVCTHTDKGHIHNHIYYNSTAYDRSRKFRNFIGSSFALRRLSDRVCLEHALSVVHGRGGVISFRAPGHDRAARLRASTLGAGYGREDIQAVIDGKAPTRQPKQARPRPAPQRVNLLIDIQEKMRQGKGPAYERWAKVYNLKQMAAALQFLQEHGLTDYDALAEQTTAAVDRFHALAGEIQSTEARLSQTSELMAAVVSYAKTRPVFDGYKAAKYSKKYLAQHEAELADYRAAKAAINDILGGAKLPKMDVLKKERRELADKKKALYAEYREAQRQMRELVAVKGSVDHLLGLTDGRENKARER